VHGVVAGLSAVTLKRLRLNWSQQGVSVVSCRRGSCCSTTRPGTCYIQRVKLGEWDALDDDQEAGDIRLFEVDSVTRGFCAAASVVARAVALEDHRVVEDVDGVDAGL